MKEIIETSLAPAAIGPYSQAVKAGNLLFVSGQIPLDPRSGAIVGSNAAEQAEQVMRNLVAVLEAGGTSPANLVKTTIFLTDMQDFAAVNQVYGAYFDQAPPARATVQVGRLPKDVLVEIDGIAIV